MQFREIRIDSSHCDNPRDNHATDAEVQTIWPQSADSKMPNAEDAVRKDILLEFAAAESKVNRLDSSRIHLVTSRSQGRQI